MSRGDVKRVRRNEGMLRSPEADRTPPPSRFSDALAESPMPQQSRIHVFEKGRRKRLTLAVAWWRVRAEEFGVASERTATAHSRARCKHLASALAKWRLWSDKELSTSDLTWAFCSERRHAHLAAGVARWRAWSTKDFALGELAALGDSRLFLRSLERSFGLWRRAATLLGRHWAKNSPAGPASWQQWRTLSFVRNRFLFTNWLKWRRHCERHQAMSRRTWATTSQFQRARLNAAFRTWWVSCHSSPVTSETAAGRQAATSETAAGRQAATHADVEQPSGVQHAVRGAPGLAMEEGGGLVKDLRKSKSAQQLSAPRPATAGAGFMLAAPYRPAPAIIERSRPSCASPFEARPDRPATSAAASVGQMAYLQDAHALRHRTPAYRPPPTL